MLVVDDLQTHCDILQAYLRHWGIHADSVNRDRRAGQLGARGAER